MIHIVTTGDGSHSLWNESLQEPYHSLHGAIEESRHVYVKQGMLYARAHRGSNALEIFELGLGTGLNVFLSALEARKHNLRLNYTAVEPCPVSSEVVLALNYPQILGDDELFRCIHTSAWGEWTNPSEHLRLLKLRQELEWTELRREAYDLVYYDAFAPRKTPHLWSADALAKVAESLKPAGIFVTYAATGQLRRDLEQLGLVAERLPGAPGKREMIRAEKK